MDSDLEEPGFCSRKTWIKIQKNQDSDPGKPKFRSRKIEFRSRKIRIQIHENLDQTEKILDSDPGRTWIKILENLDTDKCELTG